MIGLLGATCDIRSKHLDGRLAGNPTHGYL
jgi:hypothetical protein